MSVDGFPSIMIPCEQQGCVNPSVQSIWPKKQNFQSAELHLLIEAICALTPSLQISNTGYSSPINCHSPRHDLHVNDPCGQSSNHARLMRDNSVPRQPDPSCSPDLHPPLSMERVQPLACDVVHPWEPSPVTGSPQCGSPKTKPILLLQNSMSAASSNNSNTSIPLQSLDSNSSKSETSNTSNGQLLPKKDLTYWPRQTRKKKTWLLKTKTSKALDTIPENQEWRTQGAYQHNFLTSVLPETFEPKSVFENDSDSEDDVED